MFEKYLPDSSNTNDRAVSPVIGVILMVAITVILASIVGTYVLGLQDLLQQPATAGVSVDEQWDKEEGMYEVRVLLTSLGEETQQITIFAGGTKVGTLEKVGQSKKFLADGGTNVVVRAETGRKDEGVVIRDTSIGR